MSRTIGTTTDIDAPAEKIWSVLADFPAYPSWNPYYRFAEGELKVGSRVMLKAAVDASGKTSVAKPLVTDIEKGRRVTWRNHFIVPGLMTATHTFVLIPLAPNRTRFEQTEKLEGVLVSLSSAIIEQVEVRLQQLAQAVKERSENR